MACNAPVKPSREKDSAGFTGKPKLPGLLRLSMSKKTRSRAHDWWSRALKDGAHCEAKRRERFFEEYLAEAALVLLPGELDGPFRLLYRMGFRLGYDNAKLKREREDTFLPHPRKRAKLG